MSIDTSLNAIWTSLSLLGLVYLAFWKVRVLAEDWFRDQVFQLRDNLFDEAASGMISFNHPAYGTLRQTMNGYIRFCHKLSLLHIVIIALSLEKPIDEEGVFRHNWKIVTEDLDSNVFNSLENYRKRMELLVVTYIIFSSPIISTVLSLFILPGIAINSVERFRKRIIDKWAESIRNSKSFQPVLIDIADTAYVAGDS